MVKKNCFENLCDKLDAEYVGDINEITFSRRYILKNIDTSKDT